MKSLNRVPAQNPATANAALRKEAAKIIKAHKSLMDALARYD